MATCATCGQVLPTGRVYLLDTRDLLAILKTGVPHRQVYRGQDGHWYVTHGGGETTSDAVRELRDSGQIRPAYSGSSDDCLHVGRTLDCKRTTEERMKHRRAKDAPLIYVDDA